MIFNARVSVLATHLSRDLSDNDNFDHLVRLQGTYALTDTHTRPTR